MLSAYFDAAEHIYRLLAPYGQYDLDNLLMVNPIWVFLMISLLIISFRRYMELSKTNRELTTINEDLKQAISEIKQLQGIIPICATCKKVRDDAGFWGQVEKYVTDHSGAQFSHGICPDCARKHYQYVTLPDNEEASS